MSLQLEKNHAMHQPAQITVIGAGFMGCVIATIYARHGFDVVLHDAVPGMLGSFSQRALPIAKSLGTPRMSPEDIVSRVRLAETLEAAVDGTDLVHEVIQEDLALKQELFKRLDQLCAPSVVLASNTSSFLLSHLCRDVVHKKRVVGIHYITPAHIVQAVEIIVADFTPPELIVWARAFVTRIDHVPIVCREKPGFLINRMQFALMAEMHRIVDEGLASAEDVDNAIRLSLGPRWALWGGLACEDLVASKRTAVAMLEYMHAQTGQSQYEVTDTLRQLVSENKLGAAAGEGWFEWSRPNAELVMERDRQLAEILAWLAARKSIENLEGRR